MFLSVDPGIEGTGFAVWSASDIAPVETGVFYPEPLRADWLIKCASICRRMASLLQAVCPETMFCELPEFMEGSAKGRACATEGSLVKLSFIVGCFGEICRRQGITFYPVPVRDWKGQLPKKVVEERIRKQLGEQLCKKLGITDHAWDAVGIGMFAQRTGLMTGENDGLRGKSHQEMDEMPTLPAGRNRPPRRVSGKDT